MLPLFKKNFVFCGEGKFASLALGGWTPLQSITGSGNSGTLLASDDMTDVQQSVRDGVLLPPDEAVTEGFDYAYMNPVELLQIGRRYLS